MLSIHVVNVIHDYTTNQTVRFFCPTRNHTSISFHIDETWIPDESHIQDFLSLELYLFGVLSYFLFYEAYLNMITTICLKEILFVISDEKK